MAKPIRDHEGRKYLVRIHSPVVSDPDGDADPSVEVDLYEILEACGVTCQARAHAVKKLLFCGNRGKGDQLADLLGADAALSRAIDLQRRRNRRVVRGASESENPATWTVTVATYVKPESTPPGPGVVGNLHKDIVSVAKAGLRKKPKKKETSP